MELIKLNKINFDNSTISKSVLDIKYKERSNLLPWKGQFSPQLIHSLLETYAKKTDTILDPFAGSGTVLYEASLKNLQAIGIELNPAAVKMAQIYLLANVTVEKRKECIKVIERNINPIIYEDLPLFNSFSITDNGMDSFELFCKIKSCMDTETKLAVRLILETYLVLIDPKENKLTTEKARFIWKKLKYLIIHLPHTSSKVRIINCDCRKIPLKKKSIDMIITSPPYINVFNYHQQKRASMELMGWDILEIAKSEIGSNRKHRSNRYLTVIQYCLDMGMTIRELHRVCKPKATLIFIVGRESTVKKTVFFNSEIVANIAEQSFGFIIKRRHERVFKNRYGQMIKEDLLVFENPNKIFKNSFDPRQIAHHLLKQAAHRAPQEEQKALFDAIELLDSIKISPLYEPSNSLQEPFCMI